MVVVVVAVGSVPRETWKANVQENEREAACECRVGGTMTVIGCVG